MTVKGYCLAAAMLFAGGAWLGWASRGRGATTGTAQAAKIDATASAALNQGVSIAKVAQAKDPAIQAAHSAVDADRARLKADEVRRAADPVQPGAAGSAGPAAAPLESPVEQDKDHLITDLTTENTAIRSQNADLKAAVPELTQAAQGFQEESTVLRAAFTPAKPWAAGAIYGTSTVGAFVERDLGPIRAGVDVVRRVLPAGNATVDVSARLGWRF